MASWLQDFKSGIINVDGFSPYAGFKKGETVASIITKAEIRAVQNAGSRQSVEFTRPIVDSKFPEGSSINRNTNQLRILNNLEDQFRNVQSSRDTAGQTLSSVRDRGLENNQTIKEIKAYRNLLTAENNALLKKGSATVAKQKNDTENASIATEIARSRGSARPDLISQMEIAAFKAAASQPASVKAQVLKQNNKKKLGKPKGRR